MNAIKSNVNNIVSIEFFEKAKTRTSYFKNVKQTFCVVLYKGKTKQTTTSSNSVKLV